MRLDWTQLVLALEHTDDGQYGVDPETGAVRFFDTHELESDDPDELWELDRYLMVEPVPRWQVDAWWEEFLDGLAPGTRAALPADPAAARRALRQAPELRSAWRAYRRDRVRRWAERWVAEQGLAPDNAPPWRGEG